MTRTRRGTRWCAAVLAALLAACAPEPARRDGGSAPVGGGPVAPSHEVFTLEARRAAGIPEISEALDEDGSGDRPDLGFAGTLGAPPPEEAEALEDQPRFDAALRTAEAGGGGGRARAAFGTDAAEEVNLDPTGELTAAESRSGGLGSNSGGRGGGGAEAKAEGTDARAPVTTWKRSNLVPNTSRLRVGDEESLPLDGVEASVRVDGFRARVVLDCLYRNDRDRALEGMFELRLPDGASPWYFAFGGATRAAAPEATPAAAADVQGMFLGDATVTAAATSADGIAAARTAAWTAPKEARMVPRERAAWAYTETTRRRVDPALLEWSGAGVFSARVFPLEPGRTHRIVLAYDLDLTPAGDALELRFDLPPGVAERAATVSVAGGPAGCTITPRAPPRAADGRTVFSYRNPAESALTLRVARPGATLLVGDDAGVGACFATTFRPELPDSAASPGSPRAVFLLDTSLSSNPERFPVWLRLVRDVLERNRATLREFAVLCFDVQSRWWREGFVPNTPENAAAFLAEADSLALEGATDLRAALSEAVRPSWTDADAAAAAPDLFLLSDGAATWGAADLGDLDAALARGPVHALYAYRTGFQGTDGATLDHLARETGGAVFSVVGDAEVASAATAHARGGFRIRGVAVAGGSDLLLSGRPTVVHAGQTLRLVGRGAPADGAPVVLSLEQDGRTFDVRVPLATVVRSDLAPRAYGEVAVGRIEELGELPASPAQAYACHFRVVGSTCSLLMLDTEEDYARFGIRPADDAARVRDEPAAAYVTKTLAERRREAADARAGLVGWLRRMEATPGFTFRAPEDLLRAIERMPAAAFDVEAPRLVGRARTWTDVPGALQEQFAAREPGYDEVTAEAARLRGESDATAALRVLSSLVEARPGDAPLARDVAYSAIEWGLPGQAVQLLRRVARSRPYEPETYRMLSDVLASAGNVDLAIVYGEVALAGEWDPRFGAFRLAAAMDHVRLLRRIERGELRSSVPDFVAARRGALEREFLEREPSVVVVISWNTDRTDVDLHVTDATGEECYYSHPRTRAGGSLTADVTQGYGPELFAIAEPPSGDLRIAVRCFAPDRRRTSLRSKVLATVYERWGAPDERVTRKVVLLDDGERTEPVATVRVP